MTTQERGRKSAAQKLAALQAEMAAEKVSWTDSIGHAEELRLYGELCRAGRLPPVVLVEGREGIGKRKFAAAAAAVWFCREGSACGVCDTCRMVARGLHPEIFWLEGDGESLKIEDVALLQEHLSLAPSLLSHDASGASDGAWRPGAARVAVIVDAERLTIPAANRLLKTLEEPPPYARVVLTTSRARSLLPTLLSRCVRWHLRPPPAEEALSLIKMRLSEQNVVPPPDDVLLKLLKRCGGGIGRTLAGASALAAGASGEGPVLERAMAAGSPGEVVRIAAELRGGVKADAVAVEFEILLNDWYRESFSGAGGGFVEAEAVKRPVACFTALNELRRVLGETKDMAGRRQITLSAQLAGESMALLFSKAF